MKQMTGFGMVMTGLLVLVTVAALGALAWFGFPWVQDNILGGGGDQSDDDIELQERFAKDAVENAKKMKGTGQFTYAQYKLINPAGASVVTLRIWRDL